MNSISLTENSYNTENEDLDASFKKGYYRSRIFTPQTSINPLIAASDPIFAVASLLRKIEYPDDREKFLHDLSHEIRAFEHRAQTSHYPANTIIAARYALCCLLDEIIALTSEWGKNNGWLHNNLLTIFHNENYGGEHFYVILKQALDNVPNNIHLLELLYLCLKFGFVGQYNNWENDDNQLNKISEQLYEAINQFRQNNNQSLFVCGDKPKPLIQTNTKNNSTTTLNIPSKKLFGITTAIAILISSCIFLGLFLTLEKTITPIYSLVTSLKPSNFINK